MNEVEAKEFLTLLRQAKMFVSTTYGVITLEAGDYSFSFAAKLKEDGELDWIARTGSYLAITGPVELSW